MRFHGTRIPTNIVLCNRKTASNKYVEVPEVRVAEAPSGERQSARKFKVLVLKPLLNSLLRYRMQWSVHHVPLLHPMNTGAKRDRKQGHPPCLRCSTFVSGMMHA